MLEFTKRECVNEYSVWCTEEDDLVGELWYDEEKGWHFSSFEDDTGYHINDLLAFRSRVCSGGIWFSGDGIRPTTFYHRI